VLPGRLLLFEDMVSSSRRTVEFWFLASFLAICHWLRGLQQKGFEEC
jgi:hypothetical protein